MSLTAIRPHWLTQLLDPETAGRAAQRRYEAAQRIVDRAAYEKTPEYLALRQAENDARAELGEQLGGALKAVKRFGTDNGLTVQAHSSSIEFQTHSPGNAEEIRSALKTYMKANREQKITMQVTRPQYSAWAKAFNRTGYTVQITCLEKGGLKSLLQAVNETLIRPTAPLYEVNFPPALEAVAGPSAAVAR